MKLKHIVTTGLVVAMTLAGGSAWALDPELDAPGTWEGISLADGAITVGVLLEAEGTYEKQDDDSSDLRFSNVEIGLAAQPLDWIRGEAVIQWEQDEDVDIDAAWIAIGGTEDYPVVLSVGRMYLPFGAFNSLMVSDPLTLELGETRETAAALSYEWGPLTAWLGLFSGELDNIDQIKNAAAALTFEPADGIQFGVSAISDLGEGGGYVDDINDVLAEGGSYDRTAAISAFASIEWERVTVSAEYLGAMEDLEWTDADEATYSQRPQAWFVDVAYAFNDQWTAALRYEGSKEFKGDEMPEMQFGAAVLWDINEFVSCGLEYLYGQFDADASDDADDRHLITAKVSLSF